MYDVPLEQLGTQVVIRAVRCSTGSCGMSGRRKFQSFGCSVLCCSVPFSSLLLFLSFPFSFLLFSHSFFPGQGEGEGRGRKDG